MLTLQLSAPPGDDAPVADNKPQAWGWMACTSHPGSRPHLVPTWDIGPHFYDHCECDPLDDGYGFVHNAFDGRERYEHGGALRH